MARRSALCLSTRRGGAEGTLRTPFGMELAPRTTCGVPINLCDSELSPYRLIPPDDLRLSRPEFFCRIKNLDPKKSFSCAYGDHQDVTLVGCTSDMPKISRRFHVPEVAGHMENRRPSRLLPPGLGGGMPRNSGPVSVICTAMISPAAPRHHNVEQPPRCCATKTAFSKSGCSLLSPLHVSVLCLTLFPCAVPLPVRYSKGALTPRRCRAPAASHVKTSALTVPKIEKAGRIREKYL